MKTICSTVFLFFLAATVFASDAAIVSGDLKVDGIHFSDSSTMNTANGLLKDKGAWSSSTLYSAGDVVQTQGSSYVCTVANTNTAPPNASLWSLLAAQGPAPNLSIYSTIADLAAYYTKAEIDVKLAAGTSQISVQSAAPPNPVAGQMYFDSVINSPKIYNGSTWLPLNRNISYVTAIVPDDIDDGNVPFRAVNITKLLQSSRLRITWSDNLRVLGSNASCQWEVLIDDLSLSPQLKTSLYVDAGLMHRQSTLIGYATGVSAGAHTIKIKVSRPFSQTANCYTGWESTFLLEAEEIY